MEKTGQTRPFIRTHITTISHLMKTNRILTTTLCLLLCALVRLPIFGQMAPEPNPMPNRPESSAYKAADENKFYVKVYGFYGLLAPGGFSGLGLGDVSTNRFVSVVNSDYKVENPFGSGLRVGGGIGYVVNDFINIGVDGEYLLNSTTTESYLVTTTFGTTSSTKRVQLDYDYRLINIIPNITFKALSKPEYYIYNRLGVIVGIPTQLGYVSTSRTKFSARPADFIIETNTVELQKNIGFGYQAALGIQFRIGGSLRGFFEVVASNLLLKSNESTAKKETRTFAAATPPEKVVTSEQKSSDLRLSLPVNSVGVGAGLAFRF